MALIWFRAMLTSWSALVRTSSALALVFPALATSTLALPRSLFSHEVTKA